MFISIDDLLTFLETFLCLSFTFNRCTGSSSLGHTTAQVWTGRLMSLKLQVKKSDGGRMRVKTRGGCQESGSRSTTGFYTHVVRLPELLNMVVLRIHEVNVYHVNNERVKTGDGRY